MNKNIIKGDQSGAAAIFTVLFFTLLMTVITIGFIQIMMRDQEQSIDDDLARSALNSAESGVEDAKRIVDRYVRACADGSRAEECDDYKRIIDESQSSCNAIPQSRTVSDLSLNNTPQGIQVSDTAELVQYYTCLNITLNTTNYIRHINDQQSDVIPLDGTRSFSRVIIRWFNKQDSGNREMGLPTLPQGGIYSLPERSSWTSSSSAVPPIMRVQLISYDRNGFTLDSLDGNSTRTLFLYPQATGTIDASFDRDNRSDQSLSGNSQKQNFVGITCNPDNQFACRANLLLPDSLLQGGKKFLLRVTPIYAATTFTLEMHRIGSGNTNVPFNGVQPAVDSTGRANDLFRRISARIRSDIGNYPHSALETSQPICKSMQVTDNAADYVSPANCTPAP